MPYRLFINRFIIAYFITIALESLTVYLAARFLARRYKKKTYAISNFKNLFLIGILPSTTTIPYLWFITPFFITDITQRIIVGELLVVVFEALLFKLLTRFNLKICLGMSFLANFNSFAIGRLLVTFFRIW